MYSFWRPAWLFLTLENLYLHPLDFSVETYRATGATENGPALSEPWGAGASHGAQGWAPTHCSRAAATLLGCSVVEHGACRVSRKLGICFQLKLQAGKDCPQEKEQTIIPLPQPLNQRSFIATLGLSMQNLVQIKGQQVLWLIEQVAFMKCLL